MVIKVNPPGLVKIPEKLLRDPELGPFFRFQREWEEKMWLRTGGGSDSISDIETSEIFEPGIQTTDLDELDQDPFDVQGIDLDELDELEEPIQTFDPDEVDSVEALPEMFDPEDLDIESILEQIQSIEEPESVSTSVDFTTTGSQTIICTNTTAITIALNATPADFEEVHIKRQNIGPVDVSGAIDGDTLKTINKRYDAPHLIFTVDANEWSII
ncbi:MAG: hypothetical protein V3W52_17325 [Syntrophobacteria bacterium]